MVSTLSKSLSLSCKSGEGREDAKEESATRDENVNKILKKISLLSFEKHENIQQCGESREPGKVYSCDLLGSQASSVMFYFKFVMKYFSNALFL